MDQALRRQGDGVSRAVHEVGGPLAQVTSARVRPLQHRRHDLGGGAGLEMILDHCLRRGEVIQCLAYRFPDVDGHDHLSLNGLSRLPVNSAALLRTSSMSAYPWNPLANN